jgi:murein L,D-transpeptidase YafK
MPKTPCVRCPWTILLGCLLSAISVTAAPYEGNYHLEIHKSERLLILRNGDRIEKQFSAALGRGGLGDKQKLGDRKTPVGTYHIVKIKESSPFVTFMQLDYPNVKDAFFGFKNNLISRTEFDRIIDALRHDEIPPQDTRLGGAIGIHGIGAITAEKLDIHSNFNWTQGCIALTNAEIIELKKYVTVGTTVVINE